MATATGRRTTKALAGILARSQLLAGVPPSAFAAVGDEISSIRLTAGEELFARGEIARHLFVVASGRLEVLLEGEAGSQQLSVLGKGAVVGEIGLIAGDTRSATVRALTASEVVAVTAAGFRRLLAENPGHADEVAARATERLRRTQLIEHFNRLFGIIEPDVLALVELLMEWVSVPAGTRLFAEDEPGDSAYLVATGRLAAFRRDGSGAEVEIGQLARGDIVGELSLIDGDPRSATVYAVRDSQLIEFSRAAYEEMLDRYPRIGLAVARMALGRQRAGARGGPHRRSFMLVAAGPGVDIRAFADRLTSALGRGARTVASTDIDALLGREGVAHIDDDDVGALRLAYALEELEERHHNLVYLTDDTWTPWSRRALRWADHVVLVADATGDPTPTSHEQELWSLATKQRHPDVSLVLLHPENTELPTGTPAWLEPRSLASHHHVRRGDAAHMARLARLLAGRGTSLVLGGGGARGFAHLGVLQVLEELDVPVDMIAGTSIGSIMAVGPALGWPAERTTTEAVGAFRKLLDYTVPATSLLRGARITSNLRHGLGDTDITDLWLPFYCVSANLTTGSVEYHDRGDLVQAIRASIAIPGVLPPVPRNGELLVDGGILDNIPVEEMRRRNPSGLVVAVDVSPVEGPVASEDYGLSVAGLSSMRARRRGGGPPNLISTMVRSSLIGSIATRQRIVREGTADLYLEVGVDGAGSLDFSTGSEVVAGAADATRDALTVWAEDTYHRNGGPNPQGGAMPQFVRTEPARRAILDDDHRRRRGGAVLLTLRDLQFRAVRFGAVVLGIAVVLALLFLMTGLTEQFHREPRRTVAGFGADAWLLREGASGAFTSAATMPVETAAGVDGATAAPIVVARHSLTEEGGEHVDIVVVGFEPGALGEPDVEDGELPREPGEVVVDESSGLDVGDPAVVGAATYRVVGLIDGRTMFAGMPMLYMAIDDAQDLLYRGQDLATAVLIDGEPASVPDGFTALEPSAIAEDATRPLERSISSVNLIRILLWLVAALIIGTMTYLSALERRRDVAVLKAVGASTAQLGISIALQGVLIALVAALVATVLQVVMVPVFPLEVSVPTRAFVEVPVIAVIVSLLAGAVGLRKAVAVDPALAFSGPGA